MENSDHAISLADGGIVTVLLANEVELPQELRDHPQVRTVEANDLSILELETLFGPNTRGLIAAGRLRDELYRKLKTMLMRGTHPWMFRSNGIALDIELRKILKAASPPEPERRVLRALSPDAPAEPAEAKSGMPKGYWATLIEKNGGINVEKSNAEEGRRFVDLAKAEGYAVNVGAAAQAVLKYKKDHGLGDRPRSAMTERMQVLKVLDDTIAGFQLLRDYVERTETENLALKAKLEKAKKVAASMLDE